MSLPWEQASVNRSARGAQTKVFPDPPAKTQRREAGPGRAPGLRNVRLLRLEAVDGSGEGDDLADVGQLQTFFPFGRHTPATFQQVVFMALFFKILP